LQDSGKLEAALQRAQMAHRSNDGLELKRAAFLRQQFDVTHPDKKAETQSVKLEGDDEEFALPESDTPEVEFDAKREKEIHQTMHATIASSEGYSYKADIANAIQQMEDYKSYAKAHPGFFRARTRVETADFLKLFAQELQGTDRVGRLKISMLMMACYQTISNPKSKLRKHIERALVGLLDCQNEYAALKKDTFSLPRAISQIFSERLRAEARLVGGRKVEFFQDVYAKLYDGMEKINGIDTSLIFKESQEEKRLPVFEALVSAMNELDQLSPRVNPRP
jgi:hypothetical protein